MRVTRIASLLLAVFLVLSVTVSCTRTGEGMSSTESTSSDEIDYNSSLPVGSEVEPSDEDFDEDDDDASKPTPGQSGDGVQNNNGDDGWDDDYYEDTSSEDDGDILEYSYSMLADGILNDNLQYFYDDNPNYAFGITADGTEVIAYKEPNGDYFDVLNGGGRFLICSTTGLELATVAGIQGYFETVVSNNNAVKVDYLVTGGDSEKAVIETTYIFRENSISVSARVSYSNTQYQLDTSRCYLARGFVNGYSNVEKRMATDWHYPENGDYPYKYVDAWVTIHTIDDTHKVYTYTRGDNIPEAYWDFYVRYPEANIPINLVDETGSGIYGLDYTMTYDLVLERTDDPERDTDYLALFEGKGSDFAAGIAPITDSGDNTTVFTADEVELNFNVTNLTQEDLEFSVRYDIRDYYGNIIDYGIYINSTAFAGMDANRSVKISADKTGYGIYFVNLLVVTPYSTYREYYPLALLDDYQYKYNRTSPFGIVQFLGEDDMSFDDSYSLINKIGVAISRGTFTNSSYERNIEFLKKSKNNGFRIIAHGGSQIVEDDYFEDYGEYFDTLIYGNEFNLRAINGEVPLQEAFDDYIRDYYNPSREATRKFGKKQALAGVSGGQMEWYDLFYENGLWDDFEAIALHTYGIPYAPDNPAYIPYTWTVEGGLIRTVQAQAKYGKKDILFDETGYHTAQGLHNVDLRTQADYNTRCFILGTNYDVVYTGTYCLLDYSNAGVGTLLEHMEYHFGNFYYPDYFGRILPKPAGIAFAMMTRELESVQDLVESTKYSGDKRRVFKATTALQGDVFIAWTNISPLGNDAESAAALREPTMPWNPQWSEGETVEFDAVGATVTVTDNMGRDTVYTAQNGKVSIPLTGEPCYIKGVK